MPRPLLATAAGLMFAVLAVRPALATRQLARERAEEEESSAAAGRGQQVTEAYRKPKEPAVLAAEVRHACRGGWVFDRYAGNCTHPDLKCYSLEDDGSHANHGSPGFCQIAHRKRCEQEIFDDESSGNCRAGTVCRTFKYKVVASKATVSKLLKGGRRMKVREIMESFCIIPDSDMDNELLFMDDVVSVKRV